MAAVNKLANLGKRDLALNGSQCLSVSMSAWE